MKRQLTMFQLYVFVLFAAGPVDGAEDVLGNAKIAWKKNEARVQSGIFEWTVRHVYLKGSIKDKDTPQNPKGLVIPSKDESFVAPLSLLFSGDKAKYMYKWKVWDHDKESFVDDEMVIVYDGEKNIEFGPTTTALGFSTGVVRPQKNNLVYTNVQILPFVLTYRLNQKSGLNVEDLFLAPGTMIINEDECFPLQTRADNGKRKTAASTTLWIDPKKDYAIVGYSQSRNGTVFHKVEIDYVKDDNAGWVPSHWRIHKLTPKGSYRQLSEGTITRYQMNFPVEPEEFKVRFSPGTWVEDQSAGPKKPPNYIVREDGNRTVLPEEFGIPYDQLLKSEPGSALSSNRSWVRTILLVSTLSLLAISILFSWLKRRSKRAS